MLYSEFGPLGLLFLAAGAAALIFRRIAAGWLLILGAAGFAFLALNVDADVEGFLVSTFVLCWLIAGVGMQATWSLGQRGGRWVSMTAAGLLLALPAWQLPSHYRANDHHGRTFEARYLDSLFARLEDRVAFVQEAYSIDQLILYKLAGDHAARGRTIVLIPHDPPTVQRHAAGGYTVYAFSNARAVLEGRGLSFEPVQLNELADDGGDERAPTPIDMTVLPLFRVMRHAVCQPVGNQGWRDVSLVPSDARLMLRIDNYRPFDAEALLYLGTRDAARAPLLAISQGPAAPVVRVHTFRTDVPEQAAALSAAIAADKAPEAARIASHPVVHRVELRVNDDGQFSILALALGSQPDLALVRATVDLNNPQRATACGWPGRVLLHERQEDLLPIGEEGRPLLGQGLARRRGDVDWRRSMDEPGRCRGAAAAWDHRSTACRAPQTFRRPRLPATAGDAVDQRRGASGPASRGWVA